MTGVWPWVNNKRRRALTLLELLLVMALLAVLAALAWPLIQKPLESIRLRRAADRVRIEWSAARVAAMTSGQIHAFRFERESGQFAVAPWESSAGTPAEGSEASTQERDGLHRAASELSEGIVFVSSDQTPAVTTEPMAMTSYGTSDASEVDFSRTPPILFYPDGTTSDATLTLRNDRQSTVAVALRGLTGTARVGDVLYSDEVSP